MRDFHGNLEAQSTSPLLPFVNSSCPCATDGGHTRQRKVTEMEATRETGAQVSYVGLVAACTRASKGQPSEVFISLIGLSLALAFYEG